MICSPWWPLSAIKRISCPQWTTLGFHLERYIYTTRQTAILVKSQEQTHQSLVALGGHTARIIDDDVFNLACSDCEYAHCIAKSAVHISLLLLFCLTTQTFTYIANVTCMCVSSGMQSSIVMRLVCTRLLQSPPFDVNALILGNTYQWLLWPTRASDTSINRITQAAISTHSIKQHNYSNDMWTFKLYSLQTSDIHVLNIVLIEKMFAQQYRTLDILSDSTCMYNSC